MALNANAVVTWAQMKAYFGESDDSRQALFETLINAVSQRMDKECGRILATATYTAVKLTGNGKAMLFLPAWPVTALTSIKEDGIALVVDEDFYSYADEGILAKDGAKWSTAPSGIEITCTAGYAITGQTPTMPADLQLECMKQVAFEFQRGQKKSWGETSRSMPDGSSASDEQDLLKSVRAVCAKYRRVRL
jgi:uncharacterized phiE125 gp8 family phage protein